MSVSSNVSFKRFNLIVIMSVSRVSSQFMPINIFVLPPHLTNNVNKELRLSFNPGYAHAFANSVAADQLASDLDHGSTVCHLVCEFLIQQLRSNTPIGRQLEMGVVS